MRDTPLCRKVFNMGPVYRPHIVIIDCVVIAKCLNFRLGGLGHKFRRGLGPQGAVGVTSDFLHSSGPTSEKSGVADAVHCGSYRDEICVLGHLIVMPAFGKPGSVSTTTRKRSARDRGFGKSGNHLTQANHLNLRWNFVLGENAQSRDVSVDELAQGSSQFRGSDQYFRPPSVA